MFEAFNARRRASRRVHEIAMRRPTDRRQVLLARSIADLEAMRLMSEGDRDRVDEHLARVMAEWA